MYTVFILPHRTLDSYHQFEVLMNTEDKSRLFGICPWKMEATTVETALPDLYRLVRDKETWRAIVILADPEDMGGFETDEQNPYDFLMNRNVRHYELDGDGKIIESRIPLIRLTHMICGMPAPEPEFRAQLQNEDETKGHVPKIIYKINREEEENQRRAVSAWNTEHAFQAAPPQQVMLLTARVHSARTDEFDSVHTVWKVHTEADASEFWKRNLYPQNCRFMTFELYRHGEVRLERDYFRMWTAAFLLASNDFDPDILQAHRLYNLDIRLKNRELTERMQETVDRLNLAKYELEQSIEEEEAERRNDFSVKTPDYRVRVSVLLTPDAESERMLTGSPITPEDRFEPAATVETDGEDLSSWRRFTEKVKGNVRRQYEDCARQLFLLTAKPVLYVCNVSEQDAKDGNAFTERVGELARKEGAEMMVIAAKTEEDIAELESYEDKQMFLEELGLEESGVNRLIKKAYALLNLQTFITAGPMEVKAWTYKKGWKAPQCAGVIHTDFEKGFIRAEVIKYDDYLKYGSEAAVKEAGRMGVEGKYYVVQDGDIMHFRFNV